MDIYLYFTDRLPCGLDELEDALNESLGERGEVTGTGAGDVGSNIDIFVHDEMMTESEAVTLIRGAIADFHLPSSSQLVIDDEEFQIY